MPFPVVKLGYEAMKQISKPLTSYLKRRAKASPFFRKYVCIPPAQFYHWVEAKYRLRLMGLGTGHEVQKLSEKEAIELGGELLGEFLVFSFAFLIVYSEFQRGARKEAAKDLKQKEEQSQILNRIKQLETQIQYRETKIQDLQLQLDSLFPDNSRIEAQKF